MGNVKFVKECGIHAVGSIMEVDESFERTLINEGYAESTTQAVKHKLNGTTSEPVAEPVVESPQADTSKKRGK